MSNVSFPLIPCACKTPAAKVAQTNQLNTTGNGLMPQKFGVASNESMFSNARSVYNSNSGGGKNFYPASSYTYLKKITAIGKSSSLVPINKNTYPNPARQLSYGGINRNDSKKALQKARSGGANYRSKNYSQFKYAHIKHKCNNFS